MHRDKLFYEKTVLFWERKILILIKNRKMYPEQLQRFRGERNSYSRMMYKKGYIFWNLFKEI